MPDVPALLTAAETGDPDAILTLGLLIEHTRRDPGPWDMADVLRSLLGADHGDGRLDPTEWDAAVDGLLGIVGRAGETTPPSVAWALGKSYAPRAVPPLAALLEELLGDREREDLAEQTLYAVINMGTYCHPGLVRDTVRAAAAGGTGEVAGAARRYLAVVGRRAADDGG